MESQILTLVFLILILLTILDQQPVKAEEFPKRYLKMNQLYFKKHCWIHWSADQQGLITYKVFMGNEFADGNNSENMKNSRSPDKCCLM